jgi:light-regulated signal transduction histidine kinase (bacteriophytochrome)
MNKSLGDKFDEETKRQFDKVRDGAKAMGRLIDNLLALSQLGGHILDMKSLDLRQMIKEAWQEPPFILPSL